MSRLSIILVIIFILINTLFSLVNFISQPNNVLDIFNESILINYSDGFIRRGFLGELLKNGYILFNIDVLLWIKYFTLICYLTFCGYMIYLFRRNNISVLFLLMPYVLPYYSLIYYIKIRDFLLLILFSISIYFIKNKSNKIILFLLLNTLSIIGILTHEIYFFFSIPIFIFLFLIKDIWSLKSSYTKHFLYSIVFFIPSSIVLIASIYFHGNIHSVNVIYNDVLTILPQYVENPQLGGGIGSLSGEARNLLPYMYKDLIWNGFSRGISYTLFFIIILYIFLHFDQLNFSFFKEKTSQKINPIFLTIIFLIQFICFLPIFVVAIDWQRWFSIIIYTSLITFTQFIEYQNIATPSDNTHSNKQQYMHKDLFVHISYIVNQLKLLYSKFISSNREMVYIVTIFCIIPYFPLGNTPYQFSNILLILHNFLSKTIHHTFNYII